MTREFRLLDKHGTATPRSPAQITCCKHHLTQRSRFRCPQRAKFEAAEQPYCWDKCKFIHAYIIICAVATAGNNHVDGRNDWHRWISDNFWQHETLMKPSRSKSSQYGKDAKPMLLSGWFLYVYHPQRGLTDIPTLATSQKPAFAQETKGKIKRISYFRKTESYWKFTKPNRNLGKALEKENKKSSPSQTNPKSVRLNTSQRFPSKTPLSSSKRSRRLESSQVWRQSDGDSAASEDSAEEDPSPNG